MKDTMQRFQDESRQRQIADFLRLKVFENLSKSEIARIAIGIGEYSFQLVQNESVSVHISQVVFSRDRVEIVQNNVPDSLVVSGQMSISSALPKRQNRNFFKRKAGDEWIFLWTLHFLCPVHLLR